MGEGLLVEGLEDDFDLLLEEFAVGWLVQQRRAESLHLAGMVAPAHTENHPAPSEPVDGGIVLSQPQRDATWEQC